MIKAQGQDRFAGYRHSVCQNLASNHLHYNIWPIKKLSIFWTMTLGKDKDTILGHEKSLGMK